MAKKAATYGLLIALAFIFSYIESLIPIPIGIPGIKLGIANLVVIVALYTIGYQGAFTVSIVRILLSGLTFTGFAVMLYSLAGGILSYAVMACCRRKNLFSMIGISIAGGVSHNVGQVLVAAWQLENANMYYYLAILLVTGCVTGAIIGAVGKLILRALPTDTYRL